VAVGERQVAALRQLVVLTCGHRHALLAADVAALAEKRQLARRDVAVVLDAVLLTSL
jgi:hypothetical protein